MVTLFRLPPKGNSLLKFTPTPRKSTTLNYTKKKKPRAKLYTKTNGSRLLAWLVRNPGDVFTTMHLSNKTTSVISPWVVSKWIEVSEGAVSEITTPPPPPAHRETKRWMWFELARSNINFYFACVWSGQCDDHLICTVGGKEGGDYWGARLCVSCSPVENLCLYVYCMWERVKEREREWWWSLCYQ